MMDIPIKVISLERSINRRQEFVENNNTINNWDFFSAVDGRLLTEDQIYDPSLFVHPLAFRGVGAYGCALSHLRLWVEVYNSGMPLTIVEDDGIFRLDFGEKSKEVMASLPADWDIILWGWNFDSILSLQAMPDVSPSVMLFDQNALRRNITTFQKQFSPVAVYRLDKCFGTVGYTISPQGAQKYITNCFPMRNFELLLPLFNQISNNMGIDSAMNRIYSSTNAYVAFPPLIATKNDSSQSEIEHS